MYMTTVFILYYIYVKCRFYLIAPGKSGQTSK